ncbi:MAG: hypothetical protein HY674_12080 [Chloroflexi bacterium]|nr:hypothetical protein [Chloroflexota bacterium]
MRPLAERLRKDGLKVWFDEWEISVAAWRQCAAFYSAGPPREQEAGRALPRRRYAEKIEEGLENQIRAVDGGTTPTPLPSKAWQCSPACCEANVPCRSTLPSCVRS